MRYAAVLGLFCVSVAKAGSVSSGGGEVILHQYNPWFLVDNENETAFWCVEKTSDFSASTELAVREISDAFSSWTNTLVGMQNSSLAFPDGKNRRLGLRFAFSPTCDSEIKIKFLLGVMNREVVQVLGAHPTEHVALTVQQDYNANNGNARGFVWMTPDVGPNSFQGRSTPFWNRRGFVYHVAMHEIGHVLGIRHRPDISLMNEAFPYRIVDAGLRGLPEAVREFEPSALLRSSQFALGETLCQFFSEKGQPWFKNVRETLFPAVPADDERRQFCIVPSRPSKAGTDGRKTELQLRRANNEILGVVRDEIVGEATQTTSLPLVSGSYSETWPERKSWQFDFVSASARSSWAMATLQGRAVALGTESRWGEGKRGASISLVVMTQNSTALLDFTSGVEPPPPVTQSSRGGGK